jgi:imidazolonepropionase-like amidohydrolase
VRVFDGKAVHEHRSVLFDKGVIVDADFRCAAPQGARVVEGSGRTLLGAGNRVEAYRMARDAGWL